MPTAAESLAFEAGTDASLIVRLRGNWKLHRGMPTGEDFVRQVESKSARRVTFDAKELGEWDSSVITFLTQISETCSQRQIELDRSALPEGLRRLVELAEAVPEKKGAARSEAEREPFLARLGKTTMGGIESTGDMLAFLGLATIALAKAMIGRARFRRTDLAVLIQDCGADALPIVTLISFLVGTILAFVGAVQLQQFGAAIYVADLVGIAMVREMGAMMTGIIMAGRTGAAFAAQLGTMKVTQEIDALTTMGFSPIEYLVVPRMVALILMMPLLCLYSDLMGIVGGAAVGVGMLDLTMKTYFQETFAAVTIGHLAGGVFKASVYGVLIAISGCLRGMQCGSSASAVGDAATSAVVTGIVFIVVACGIFAFLFNILGI
jgi:phospholipid/cholesterol/gamma-HCH transport system permease protein